MAARRVVVGRRQAAVRRVQLLHRSLDIPHDVISIPGHRPRCRQHRRSDRQFAHVRHDPRRLLQGDRRGGTPQGDRRPGENVVDGAVRAARSGRSGDTDQIRWIYQVDKSR